MKSPGIETGMVLLKESKITFWNFHCYSLSAHSYQTENIVFRYLKVYCLLDELRGFKVHKELKILFSSSYSAEQLSWDSKGFWCMSAAFCSGVPGVESSTGASLYSSRNHAAVIKTMKIEILTNQKSVLLLKELQLFNSPEILRFGTES